MKTLILNIPDTVDFDDKDAVMTIASRLYEKGKLSLGQAADMTGLSKGAFMEILSNYGVSIYNYSPSDLDRDIDNAKVIISDTSCLILLHKIGALHLLKQLFGKITITKEVGEEFNMKLPDWFEIGQPENKMYQKILEASLDKGEARAIALAIEHKDCLLIIDELKGRKYAELLGLKITGTLGVLIDAKLSGHLESIKPSLDKIRTTNFRLNKDLELKALEKSGEL